MFKTSAEDKYLINSNANTKKIECSIYLNDTIIANMMLHPEIFTNHSQNFQIFKDILIPTLSNSSNSSENPFNFVNKEKLNDAINDVDSFLNVFSDDNFQINLNIPNQRKKPHTFSISLKNPPAIIDGYSFISFVSKLVPQPMKFYKNPSTSFLSIENEIFKIFDNFSHSLDFLFHGYLWGLATSSIEILLKTAYCSFLLSINDNRNQKVKSVKYDQDFLYSFRSEQPFLIDKPTGFINLDEYILRILSQKSTFCVQNDQIFLIDSNSQLTNISMSELITERSKRFLTAKLERTQSRAAPVISTSNGFLYVGCDIPLIFSTSPFSLLQKNPEYLPKGCPHIKAPSSSDGKNIYSLISKNEIAVFTIENSKIMYTRSIKLKMGNYPLLIPHTEKLMSKHWLKNSATVTDGFSFRIILVDGEQGKFQHFIRSFSLIDGSHTGDQKIILPFCIHSISYDTYSKSYFILTPYSNGCQILRFDNIGSQPPWTAGISLKDFPAHQSLQKIFESPINKASSLSMCIFTILQYFAVPLMGCKPNSFNQTIVDYLAPPSKTDQVIKMIIESIAAMCINVSQMTIEIKNEQIENAVKTLLIILNLNIQIQEKPFCKDDSFKIISILIALLKKEKNYRNTVFFLLVTNFELLFENCPELISDSFAFFQNDLTTHEFILLTKLSKSKLFPYLYSEQMYPMFYTTRIQRIRKNNQQTNPSELSFILHFQHSLFSHDENEEIIKLCSSLTSGMFEQMILLLKELLNYNEEDFSSNVFVEIYRKFLLLIHLKLSNFSFIKSIISLIYPLLTSFSECYEKFNIDDSSMFFKCFYQSFDLYISLFNIIIDNTKINSNKTSKFAHIIQAICNIIDNKPKDLDLNKIFKNKYNKIQANLENFMDFYYEQIKNPFNKNVTQEEKILEAQILIVLADLMNIDIFHNEIDSQVKKLVQIVYKIRTDLKSSKQITAQKKDEEITRIVENYPLYLNQIKEKIAFLTFINFGKENVELTEISSFISSEMSLDEFFKIAEQIQMMCSQFLTIFKPFLEIIKISNFPIQFIGHFFQQISSSSSFLEAFDIINQFGHKDKIQDSLFDLINYIGTSKSEESISSSSFLSFSATMIFAVSKTTTPPTKKIYSTIRTLFKFICAKTTNEKLSTYFTFLCYFLRTLFDMNILEYSSSKMKKIEDAFQQIPFNYSFNFMIAHSMIHAGFKPKISLENLMALLDSISIEDLHSFCLLLYEYFIRENELSESIINRLLDEIGSTLTGCKNSLLDKALSLDHLSSLDNDDKNKFIKTPQAQINAAYEIIILFRRILLSDSKAAILIKNLFSKIINDFLDDETHDNESIKRIIAVCSIISNTVHPYKPLSFVMNRIDSQKYFISEMLKEECVGISLPITDIMKFSIIPIENIESDSFNFLNFSSSMYCDKETESKLYHYGLNIQNNSYSSSLLSFYILSCLRERIIDANTGESFTHEFIQNIKQLKVDGFEYRITNDKIMSLISKLLMNPSQGIFTSSIKNPSFHHFSFAKLTIDDDYSITESHLVSNKAINCFMTNVLSLDKPISFAVLVGQRQFPNVYFGIYTYSLKLNHCFSIIYYSTERCVLVNGQEALNLENKKQVIEFRFDPQNKKVFLSSSDSPFKPLITMSLDDINCSFVAVLPENSSIEYYLGPTAQSPCFASEENKNQNENKIELIRDHDNSEINNDDEEVYRKIHPNFVYSNNKTKDEEDDQIQSESYYSIKKEISNASKSKSILQPIPNSKNKLSDFFQFKTIKLISTILPLSTNSSVLFYSPNDPSIWSSSTADKCLSIYEHNGYFQLVYINNIQWKPLKSIKPFFYVNLPQMPVDIINSLISGLSDIHRCELITQLIIRSISYKEISIQKTLSIFSLDYDFFLNFVIKMLVIIEPFNAFNILEGRSPIDFEFNSISSRCTKTKFFDHHAAVCKILKSEIVNNKKEFFYFWFKRLLADFNDISMHFVTKYNTDYFIVQRGIKQETKEITNEDAIGYLLFPLEFGQRTIPKVEILNHNKMSETNCNTENKENGINENNEEKANENKENVENSNAESNESSKEDFVTYTFIEGNSITVLNSESKVAFLPIFHTNSSLTNSFIELAINFKYLVFFLNECITTSNLFSHEEILSIKIELRKQIYAAIISGSPFFYTHDNYMLNFLKEHLSFGVSDFTEEYIRILNIFSLSSHTIPHQIISNFIQEQSLLFDDHKAEAYRGFFPEFSDLTEKNSANKKEPFKMPPITLPSILNKSDPSTRTVLLSVKRLLQPRESLANFPFHLILNEWAYFYAVYPPAEIRIETPCSISIRLTDYVPQAIRVIDRDVDLVDPIIDYSYSSLFSNPLPGSLLAPIPMKSEFLYIKFKITENVSQHNFIVASALLPNKEVTQASSTNKMLNNNLKIDDNDPQSFSTVYIDSNEHLLLNYISEDAKKALNEDPAKRSFYIKIPDNEEVTNNQLLSRKQVDLESVIVQNREKFVADMKEMILQWTKRDDQRILIHVKPEFFYRNNISPYIDPIELASMQSPLYGFTGQRRSSHLLALRSMLLIDFNWLCAQYKEVIDNSEKQFISMLLSVNNFHSLIEKNSTSGTSYANLRINRRIGLDVRNGVSNRLDQSMFAQFASQYRSPARFRSIKRPFHIEYVGENGIDVGGLARDFSSELAKDICEYRIGLFVATPNSRNKIGSYRECLIPSPNRQIAHSANLYRTVGGLIAIGVRSKIAQPFNFPPFFWRYLAGEPIKVEDVYDVDEVFRKLINGIETALESCASSDEFDASFGNMKASFTNFRNEEVNILNPTELNNNGSSYNNMSRIILISHKNARRFIGLSLEYRIKELEEPMREINEGFWENLNFKPPSYVTPELLEFMVCGERQVDLRQLRNVTQFTSVPKEEVTMFWAALGRMNGEQRRSLLQFATGNMCIPQSAGPFFLTVEYVDAPVDKRLPATSTCFNRIHLPPYSSVEKMLKSLLTAIEYAETFENS